MIKMNFYSICIGVLLVGALGSMAGCGNKDANKATPDQAKAFGGGKPTPDQLRAAMSHTAPAPVPAGKPTTP